MTLFPRILILFLRPKMMKTFLTLFAAALLSSACTSGKSDRTIYVLTEDDYKLSCSPSGNTTYPDCFVEVPGFEKREGSEAIRNTTEAEWIGLLKSDTADIARSAALWLHVLSHQKTSLLNLDAIEKWDDGRQEEQVGFWEAYLEQYDL